MQELDYAQQRRARILRVTRELAVEGYDAVSMRRVGARAKVSLATVYELFGSKDELIAFAHADLLDGFQTRIASDPPQGSDAATRVAIVVTRLRHFLERDPELMRAALRALSSSESPVGAGRRQAGTFTRDAFEVAIADDPIADLQTILDALGHVLNSALLQWGRGELSAAALEDLLVRVARRLLRA